ncbi:4-(cytidine 5'-diphospho)-2-C-methyl-D-erythritol kinase [Acidithiobacillus sp. AMEEHan]|uniref:4-(cytidine 5'-diphospho)-2-C-methyl-D-erythritol kinase n=1 Tax=Acidithiobacillus sp. AMEEHan TaxID=2994951 RepID=UPI0027E3FB8E|nr:4-(cytidine 5'-diphospho)-2-C-methyl-D-erythritol kinase [Acidithiobacillus sp. AMEEHan]
MMNAQWYPAPAKLNLMLRVIGQREDGYHFLQSVFQFLDLHDELRFASAPAGVFRSFGGPPGLAPEKELTLRAARLLAERCGVSEGVEITLRKRLPEGGGVGGGSSDAATTLLVLNQLWNCALTRTELMAMGTTLGADVPIFLFGRSAWAEGIGELLQPMPPIPELPYLLVHPGVSVATAEIFRAPELTRQHPPSTISAFLGGIRRTPWNPWSDAVIPSLLNASIGCVPKACGMQD